MLAELERVLDTLQAFAEKQDDTESRQAVARIRTRLLPEQMVTTTEAAQILGFGSINTVKSLVKGQKIPHTKAGSRMLIPLCEVMKLKDSQWVAYLQEGERAVGEFGGEPMTQEEMDMLSEGRPGTLPWKRKQSALS